MQTRANGRRPREQVLFNSKTLLCLKIGAKNGFSKICLETAHDASLEATERSTMEEQ